MSEESRKPAILPVVIVMTVAVLVAYPLSVGPAAWVINSAWCPLWLGDMLAIVYLPLEMLADNGPTWLHDVAYAYVDWWTSRPGPAARL
jgi:hypothetical protein